MRVLLVEDNEGDADLVREAFLETRDAGVELTHVSLLGDAVARVAGERFDVILLDLSLPDASGLEGLTRLREASPSAPIVVLTGLADQAVITRALQQGAQDFLHKGEISGSGMLRAIRAARDRQLHVERGRLLSEVGPALSSSSDPVVTVRALVDAVTKDFATMCTFDGALELDGPIEAVSRAGQGRGTLHVALADVPHHDELRKRGMQSAIVVNFAINGRSDGVLVFARDATRVPYGPIDVGIAEEVSARLTSSLEHAGLLAIALREQHRAEVANHLRDEFLATLSHELRTPLNAILGWTQMLRAGQVAADKVPRALETIERNTLSQAALIEDILDVSRIITGKMRLELRPVGIVGVIASAIETVRPAADAKGVSLVLDTVIEAKMLQGDPDRLQQVLWNLLANAVKFTPRGGQVGVAVRVDSQDAALEISVVDNGLGIAVEFLPYVFDRFRQADSSMKRTQAGLGLGLAITRQLVELHGGTIRVTSNGPNQGATFIVRLPISTLPVVHEGAQPREERPASGAALLVPVDVSGLVVLVVDDDADTRELLRTLLETALVVVTTAASAEEGFVALCACPPNVLISDIGMPGATGYELIARIRALPHGQGGLTPAIALTAFARAEDRAEALRVGFDRHLAKPVKPHELLSMLSTLRAAN